MSVVSFNAYYFNLFHLHEKTENLIRLKEVATAMLNLQRRVLEKDYVAHSIITTLASEYRTSIFVFITARIDVNQRLIADIEE